ncbi:GAF and ANTAR domain-containing protein [Kribbella sp. NPDC050820]|uniref:GAF and ANTAR domain-containing protein n=1 Tax=Kribbella sp. NPDC050820 TaxID=3155408 RepID=UPI0034021815
MTDDVVLVARLTALAAANSEPEGLALRMAQACQEFLGVDGVAITIENTSPRRTVLCATDAVAARLEDLQEVTGEGPCRDAYRLNEPIRLTLADDRRWPVFSAAAFEAVGRLTTLSFPMRPEGPPWGAISMYVAPDREPTESPATAQVLVDAIGAVLLRAPAEALVAAGDLGDDRTTVNQATGMVIVQADLSHADALAILRARAYAADQPLAAVAAQVVHRRISFKDLID